MAITDIAYLVYGADSKVKYNTCQPVKVRRCQPLPRTITSFSLKTVSPSPAWAAEPQRTSNCPATAAPRRPSAANWSAMHLHLAVAHMPSASPCSADAGRPAIKLHPESILSCLVIHLLRLRWSPEQIALTLARLYPLGHEYRVSHETIYNCIYAMPVGELHQRADRHPASRPQQAAAAQQGKDRRGQIPDMLSIHVRPPRSKTASFPGTGKVISSRRRQCQRSRDLAVEPPAGW